MIRNIDSTLLAYTFCIFCPGQSNSKGPKSSKQREEVQIQGCHEHNDLDLVEYKPHPLSVDANVDVDVGDAQLNEKQSTLWLCIVQHGIANTLWYMLATSSAWVV